MPPEVTPNPCHDEIFDRLKANIRQAEQTFLLVGPDIDALRKAKYSYRQIAARIEHARSTVCDYHQAWLICPTAESLTTATGKTGTFGHALMAAKVAVKLRKSLNGSGQRIPSSREIFDDAVNGGTSARQLRKKYEKQFQSEELNRLRAAAAGLPVQGWENRCHHANCIDILATMPDNSIDFIVLDPPYWNYLSRPDGGLGQDSYRQYVLTECDHSSEEESRNDVLKVAFLAKTKLSRTGVILYFNSGLVADDPTVVSAFKDAGIPNYRAGIWHKRMPAAMDMGSPHTTTCERWLIQCRTVQMKSWDYSVSRDNVIVTDLPVTKQNGQVYHQMQKPISLFEGFLKAYCAPNSLVFDAFGCSGAASLAAINLGHRFVYSELNKQNFEYGSGRIAERLQRPMTA